MPGPDAAVAPDGPGPDGPHTGSRTRPRTGSRTVGPRIAVGPGTHPWAAVADRAVSAGGGAVVGVGDRADGLVWMDPADAAGLRQAIDAAPEVRWVQLPWAGVETVASVFDHDRVWTCAKGSYGEPVAEHALALALAGLRFLPERIAARTWGAPKGGSLYDADVTILGGGGIAIALIRLLEPFRARVTVVRRQAVPVPGSHRTLPTGRLREALPGARVVFLALALTPETSGIIGAAELAAMDRRAWLVNVARGRHVDTQALVDALRRGTIAGAGTRRHRSRAATRRPSALVVAQRDHHPAHGRLARDRP